MSFDIHSNFDKRANFTEVKFGEGKPVLEVELNELQNIQNEARADLIRDSIPSGFTSLGELDFTYSATNENVIRLASESVAYVNGYRVLLPKGMTIDLGEAPKDKPREDLVFLEVWREEVNYEDTLHVQGGENLGTMTNPIKDSRYPIETSRRIALKWRIRHVADVDFNTFADGLQNTVGDGTKINSKVQAQGGNELPLQYNAQWNVTNLWWKHAGFFDYIQRPKSYGVTGHNVFADDTGLFIAGMGSDESKSELKTIDGYVYAIPMFRIKRKPSCGKASPFEYSKINPKVDYDKFSALVNEDKVERVIGENIKGNSLVNLLPDISKFTGNGVTREGIDIIKLTQTGTTEYFQATDVPLTQNTKYSLIYEVVESNVTEEAFCLAGDTGNNIVDTGVILPTTIGRHCIAFTSSQTNVSPSRVRFAIRTLSAEGTYVKFRQPILLQGDFTDKEQPEYFLGIKSLGELENNVVEVKTEVLDTKTYDPCTGNVKLSSAPNVTHVMTDNAIRPTFVAEVKRGEAKVSDLTEFKKLDTQGNETIDFTKIKGKTLQNLAIHKDIQYSTSGVGGGLTFTKLSNGAKWIVTDNTKASYRTVRLNQQDKLKPNTVYTLIFDVTKDDFNVMQRLTIAGSTDPFHGSTANRLYTGDYTVGRNTITFTTHEDISTYTGIGFGFPFIEASSPVGAEFILENVMLLEGDYTSVNLPYIEDITSVGENEYNTVIVKSCGKNVFDLSNFIDTPTLKVLPNGFAVTKYYQDTGVYVGSMLKPNTKYVLQTTFETSGTTTSASGTVRFHNPSSDKWINAERDKVFITPSDIADYAIVVYGSNQNDIVTTITDIQIEEAEVKSPFEPYNGCTQEIHLKEPLRRLPNMVYDEILGNKVTRRIQKLVLDGSEPWQLYSTQQEKTLVFTIPKPTNCMTGGTGAFSTTLIHGHHTRDEQHFYFGQMYLNLYINKTDLPTQDVAGIREWLKKNPTTIYYELETPIIEEIEHYYEKESVKTYQLDAPLMKISDKCYDEIIDNKLIRRIGSIILDGSQNWALASSATLTNTLYFSTTALDSSAKYPAESKAISDKFQSTRPIWSVDNEGIAIEGGSNRDTILRIRINKARLSAETVETFKEWLKSNPVTVLYELESPIVTQLKEAPSINVDFSLTRQFKYPQCLKTLPSGIKDIASNVVTRNVGLEILDSSKTFTQYFGDEDTNETICYYADCKVPVPKDTTDMKDNFITNALPLKTSIVNATTEGIALNGSQCYIRVKKSSLPSIDLEGFKKWLDRIGGVQILYPLKAPTEETLVRGVNDVYAPCHDSFDSSIGSLYVTDGTVHTSINSVIPKTEDIMIKTEFREITGKDLISDCHYKKHYDGYELEPRGKGNILDTRDFTYFDIVAGIKNEYPIHFYTKLKSPNVRLTLFSNSKPITNVNIAIKGMDKKGNVVSWTPFHPTADLKFTFKNYRDIEYFVLYTNNQVPSNIRIDGICMTYDDVDSSILIPHEPYYEAFENLDKNDIDDLRNQVSLTGLNYQNILTKSFDKLLRGEL